MRPPIRIAVLECNKVRKKGNLKYGGYHGIFSKLLHRSAEVLGQPDRLDPHSGLEILQYDVVTEQEYPALESVDALLLTGSKHNSFENHPWILKLVEFTRKAIEDPRVKLLGICFGHQIIGRALGMDVGRSPAGWELAVCDVDLTPAGKELFGLDRLRIQQMHQDIVHAYPPNILPLGHSPCCEVQGMYMPGHFITVQGHPEFTEDTVSEIVTLRGGQGVFSKEQTEDALNRAGKPHDGVAVGVAFLTLLLQ